MNEIELHKTLDHKNIVKLIEVYICIFNIYIYI